MTKLKPIHPTRLFRGALKLAGRSLRPHVDRWSLRAEMLRQWSREMQRRGEYAVAFYLDIKAVRLFRRCVFTELASSMLIGPSPSSDSTPSPVPASPPLPAEPIPPPIHPPSAPSTILSPEEMFGEEDVTSIADDGDAPEGIVRSEEGVFCTECETLLDMRGFCRNDECKLSEENYFEGREDKAVARLDPVIAPPETDDEPEETDSGSGPKEGAAVRRIPTCEHCGATLTPERTCPNEECPGEEE